MSTVNYWIQCKEAASHRVSSPHPLHTLLAKEDQRCDALPVKKAGSGNEQEIPQCCCINHTKTHHAKHRLVVLLLLQTFGCWILQILELCDYWTDVLVAQYLFQLLKLTVFKVHNSLQIMYNSMFIISKFNKSLPCSEINCKCIIYSLCKLHYFPP